jgi:cobalt-zinc-cadmium efflux system membrane fusion protein
MRAKSRIHLHPPVAIAAMAVLSIALMMAGINAMVLAAPADDSPNGAKQKPAADDVALVKLTEESIKRYGITIGRATKQKLASELVVPAQVSFNTSAMAVVGCPVQGRVSGMKAAVGDVVKQGDELLVVESPELGEAQSDYLQKLTGVAASEAAIEPAKSAYERAKSLYESSQGIALTELQKRNTEYKMAQSALLIARSVLKAAQSRLKLLGMNKDAVDKLVQSGDINPRYTVRAPLSGTITERLVTLGELVKPDREKLLVVADMSTLWVIADVPESRVAEIKTGAKASIAVGDQSFDGTVSNVGVSVDPSTRSVPVRIEIKAAPGVKPGMFAEATLTSTAGDEPVVAIPAGAIQSVDGSTAVFLPVDGKPDTFARRMVSVGDSAGGMVSIIAGLEGGERVVTSGAFILKAELGKAAAKDND